MQVCSKCILNDNYPGISFNSDGVCSLCSKDNNFKPLGEQHLIRIFERAKKKNPTYNALVPISGGKDSAYILHLAVNVYKLNVLTMSYDNGLLSNLAIQNINTIVDRTKVKHIYYKPNLEVQKKIYKHSLVKSGDFCGPCDIGTRASILKVAHDYSVPIILYGTSPLENDSFVPDTIQDVARLKHILSNSKELSKKEIDDFLIYPNLTNLALSIGKRIGYFAKDVAPLFFIENPSDAEMGNIIAKELGWKDNASTEYTKHFDCIAEPLTNYVRNKIYGYERHICQYSNMVRRNEITREQANELYLSDHVNIKPSNYNEVLNYLGINEDELSMVETLKPLIYENKTSRIDKIFLRMVKLKQKYL